MDETLLDAIILAGKLLGWVLPFMILGVFLAEFINALGIVNKLSFLARPITNFSHLRQECGASFLLAFGSPTAANAMLAEYRGKGLIDKREMFLSSMINTFPAILMHWRSMLPPLIPLLGIIGLIYFLILVLVGLVKTGILMVVCRFLLKGMENSEMALESDKPRPPFKEAFKQSLPSSKKMIKRMFLFTVPTMFAVCILIKLGAFDMLASFLSGISSYFPIPSAGLGIIAAQFGHEIAAYTTASSLLAAGEITAKGVILSLLVGNVLTSIVTMFSHLTPYYVGIFGPKEGLQLMILSSAIREGMAVILVFLLVFFW